MFFCSNLVFFEIRGLLVLILNIFLDPVRVLSFPRELSGQGSKSLDLSYNLGVRSAKVRPAPRIIVVCSKTISARSCEPVVTGNTRCLFRIVESSVSYGSVSNRWCE